MNATVHILWGWDWYAIFVLIALGTIRNLRKGAKKSKK